MGLSGCLGTSLESAGEQREPTLHPMYTPLCLLSTLPGRLGILLTQALTLLIHSSVLDINAVSAGVTHKVTRECHKLLALNMWVYTVIRDNLSMRDHLATCKFKR